MTAPSGPRRLQPALVRALDMKAIRERGPLAAIMVAEREEVRIRRAAIVMGLHWHDGPKVEAHEVLTALRMGELLQRPKTRAS